MLDFRYHVSSLAAVFLALGIGIIVGLGFGDPAITRQQTKLLQDSNAKLDTVLGERTQDRLLLSKNREALRALAPRLTRDLLIGRRVAVVRDGDYPEAAQEAQDAIAQAGGIVSSVTVLTDRFDVLSDKERQALITDLGASAASPALGPASFERNRHRRDRIPQGMRRS